MTCGLAPSGFSLLASLAIWLNPYCCRTASADNPALYRLNDRAVGLARFFSICCCESTGELETATSEAIAYPSKKRRRHNTRPSGIQASDHRQIQMMTFSTGFCLFIASIRMAHHPGGRVVPQHTRQSGIGIFSAIAHNHHPGML